MAYIDETLFLYIKTNVTLPSTDWVFLTGSAEGASAPYIVMRKIADPEIRLTLCDAQGESGEALYQFSAWDGQATATNAAKLTKDMNEFKVSISGIKGVIGESPNDFRINKNQTSGVILLNEGSNSLNTWGVFFETILQWEKV